MTATTITEQIIRQRVRQQAAAIMAFQNRPILHDYQRPPEGDWNVWLILAGRGAGKTYAGSEWTLDELDGDPKEWALVGRTVADVRDVMVRGPAGLIRRAEERGWPRPEYRPSLRRLDFHNGSVCFTYSSEEPDQLRGPQHHGAWSDELAAWDNPETWHNLRLTLRLGVRPRVVGTTTPKPVRLIRELVSHASEGSDVVITRGRTSDNAVNLPAPFLEAVTERYGGTRLGRQELEGELLEEIEGAFWSLDALIRCRVHKSPPMARIVVAIDPAVTHGEDADYTGICVAGKGNDGRYYVFHAEQVRLSPAGWAKRAIDLFDTYDADALIAERNQGGEMVRHTIRTVRRDINLREVVATKGKAVRAEPIAALYEQGHISHVGELSDLENQMIVFPVAGDHDDLVDALVWAMTDLSKPKARIAIL